MICDAHIHFFSPGFFELLAAQAGPSSATDVLQRLGWHDPVRVDALSDRWAAELDRHGVARAALIASLPRDEMSVVEAVKQHPDRFVGFFMLDPTRDDAIDRATRALDEGARGICLFPAMHRYAIGDERVDQVFALAAAHPGVAMFVHCGVLSVGVRKKLGLASPFDIRFGNPLDLHGVALRFPTVPVIIPHFGAGLFREALMVADLCPNVHLDSSSSNSWIRYIPGLTLSQVFEAAVGVVGQDRVLFGTDSSFFPRGWNRDVFDAQMAAVDDVGVPAATRSRLVGGNFDRLFPL